jgi:Cytochrome P460
MVFHGAGAPSTIAANPQHCAATGLAFQSPRYDTAAMRTPTKFALLTGTVLFSLMALNQTATAPSTSGPEYTSDGQLKVPDRYREWVYLSTGFDMSYSPAAMQMDHHMFDNVFVNPESYKSFLAAGTWPDKTMLVLEVRKAEGKGSINQRGNFQGTERMGLEVHVKDESRFPGQWAFFGFDDSKIAKMVPTDAACYTCHSAHAAVDTTFVQFYPTLLPIAKSKGTLSASYQKEGGTR